MHVCAHMGCWIELADETDHSIRFKEKDAAVVSPARQVDSEKKNYAWTAW